MIKNPILKIETDQNPMDRGDHHTNLHMLKGESRLHFFFFCAFPPKYQTFYISLKEPFFPG